MLCEMITKKFICATLQGSKQGLNILKAILMSFNKLEFHLLSWQNPKTFNNNSFCFFFAKILSLVFFISWPSLKTFWVFLKLIFKIYLLKKLKGIKGPKMQRKKI